MALDLNVVDDVIEQKDQRIAELEQEVEALTAALQAEWDLEAGVD